MECDHEIRTVEALSEWNTSNQLPYIDYKVIAIELSIGDLRQALNVYVSSIFCG